MLEHQLKMVKRRSWSPVGDWSDGPGPIVAGIETSTRVICTTMRGAVAVRGWPCWGVNVTWRVAFPPWDEPVMRHVGCPLQFGDIVAKLVSPMTVQLYEPFEAGLRLAVTCPLVPMTILDGTSVNTVDIASTLICGYKFPQTGYPTWSPPNSKK